MKNFVPMVIRFNAYLYLIKRIDGLMSLYSLLKNHKLAKNNTATGVAVIIIPIYIIDPFVNFVRMNMKTKEKILIRSMTSEVNAGFWFAVRIVFMS
jgi:hypothetical protein